MSHTCPLSLASLPEQSLAHLPELPGGTDMEGGREMGEVSLEAGLSFMCLGSTVERPVMASYNMVNSSNKLFTEDNSQTCRGSRKSPRFMHLNDFFSVHAKITEVLL